MIGFRVLQRSRKLPYDLVQRFRGLPVANVSDVMSRMAAGGVDLQPRHASGKLCGPALTVKCRPGDNLMIHKALDMAEPGDVVIVDAGGDTTNALVGELMVAHAIKRQLGGLVLYGAIRDSAWIGQNTFPVFATGITHRGPYKDGPGEINVSIAIAGMVVEPGDLVIGDDDGVVSVPFEDVEAVCEAARKKAAAEQKQMEAILTGNSDRSWIDMELHRKGGIGKA